MSKQDAIVVTALVLAAAWHAGASDVASPSRFAAIAYTPRTGAVAENRAAIADRIAVAAARGARAVVVPELALTGRLPDTGVAADAIPGPTTEFFSALARRHRLWIAFPVIERTGARYHVTTALVDSDGANVYSHRKISPRLDGSDGGGIVRGLPSDALESIPYGPFRIGVVSGDDVQSGVPRLAARGASTILVSANWRADDGVDWVALCQDMAQRLRVNLVVASPAIGDAPAMGGIYHRDGEHHAMFAGDVAIADVPPPALPPERPLGLPPVPMPSHANGSERQREIGRRLFFDQRLSSDGTVSCATCHRPEHAFTNGAPVGTGVGGRLTTRNVPSLLNVAYRRTLHWDGLSTSLETQAKYPMSHPHEMNLPYLDAAARIRQWPEYEDLWASLPAGRELTFDDIAGALAAYERSLLSANSPFDRFYFAGETRALSAKARQGFELFRGKAACSRCHTVARDYALFSDGRFHNTGIGFDAAARRFSDLGVAGIAFAQQSGMFATPSLRNVADTPPYMHDGSLQSLREVVEHYNRGGTANPFLAPEIKPLGLATNEVDALVEFLHALNGRERYAANGERLDQTTNTEGVRVAAVQMAATPALDLNLRKIESLLTRAARDGARIVVLPEHALTAPLLPAMPASRARALARQLARSAEPAIGRLASKLGIWVVASTLDPGDRPDEYFVAAIVVDDQGHVVQRQRKLAPRPDRGDGAASPGQLRALAPVEFEGARIAAVSGDDLSRAVPQHAATGVRSIFVSASWTGVDVVDRQQLAAQLSRRYGVHIVIANLAAVGAPGTQIILDSGAVHAEHRGEGVVATVLPAAGPTGARLLGLPSVPVPARASQHPVAVDLGRQWFFDPMLSGDGRTSCSSCHDPERAFTDGKRVAVGVHGRSGQRNTPTLLNTAYKLLHGWDGSARTLGGQIERAVRRWDEMDTTIPAVIDYVSQHPRYAPAITALTGGRPLTFDDVVDCFAAYQRTLLSGAAPFDRYYFGGDRAAIDAAAVRGLQVFRGKARCSTCHRIDAEAALFTDHGFHNTGVGYHKRFDYLGYAGDGLENNTATRNTFRGEYLTPSLRDVALTAPYMHDGSLPTLDAVIDFYDRGGVLNPFSDPVMKPIGLSKRERSDLVAFLNTLTGERRPEPAARLADR